jgi:hypothetical protein
MPKQATAQGVALSPPRENDIVPGPIPSGRSTSAPLGQTGEAPAPGELQLTPIASDPVIELDPVESDDESEEEAPILAELDRDDEESESKTELDETPDVIFPPAVAPQKKPVAPPPRRSNRAFLLATVVVSAVALVGGLAGFLISHGRPVNGAPTPTTDPLVQALVQKGAMIETDETDPKKPIVAIHLVGPQFNGADLSVVKIAPQLRTLDLSDARVNNMDLEQITILSALENLTLAGTKVSDSGMSSVKKLTNLRKLDLSRTIVTDRDPGLLELRGLQKLKELVLVGSTANGEALKVHLPHLKIKA